MRLWSYRRCRDLAEYAISRGLGTKIANAIADGDWPTKAADALARRSPDKARVVADLRKRLMAEQKRILDMEQRAKEMDAARSRAYRGYRARKRMESDARTCAVCDEPLRGRRSDALFCSTKCRAKHARAKNPALAI
jgi:exonuclease VII large subunit